MNIYRDLEKIEDYEISNTFAYELALRTSSFKDELLVYLAKDTMLDRKVAVKMLHNLSY